MNRGSTKSKKFTVAFCGNSAVGKTALFTRITKGIFDEHSQPSISADVVTKQVNVDGQVHVVALWDTAGQEKFRSTTKSYLRGLHGVFFCFDVTKKESFNCIELWIQEYEQAQSLKDVASRYLIGCKKDLGGKREITTAEAESFAKSKSLIYVECSSKTGEGVDNLLSGVIKNFKQKNPTLATIGITKPTASGLSESSETIATAAPSTPIPKKEEEPIALAKPEQPSSEPQESGGCC